MNKDADGLRRHVAGLTPDLFHDLFMTYDAASMADEGSQNVELDGREMGLLFTPPDATGHQVHFEACLLIL